MAAVGQQRDRTNSHLSKSAQRVISLLECFTPEQPELKVSELAARLQMRTSSVYRYLAVLEEAGYIEAVGGTGRYALGLRLVERAGVSLSRLEIHRHGQAILDALADALQMNANLAVLFRGDTLHLAFSVRTEVRPLYTMIGRRTPAHCTALGKAIYAHLPWRLVRDTIERYGWRPLTPYSIRDFDTLKQELEQTRLRGFAQDRQEVSERSSCIGAPVFQSGGHVAGAISVSMSVERLAKIGETLVVREVKEHAERLSALLGYMGRPLSGALSSSSTG